MSVAGVIFPVGAHRKAVWGWGAAVAVVLVLSVALPLWPEGWVMPLAEWITRAFAAFSATAKPVTRAFGELLGLPLVAIEAVLYRGIPALGVPALPWTLVLAGGVLFAHWAGGLRLALLAGATLLYLAVFGLWVDAMKTLALVIDIVPLAALAGFVLGLWALSSPRVERVLNGLLDLMQATPHMAYLAPTVVLFGFGNVPAILATVGFALPPMARLTVLGLRSVPAEIVEAGEMAGCTPRMLLWKVRLPAARASLLLGLNQVVMQTLAMVVIAALVGVNGLGQKLLFSLQQLRIGKAVEQGIAISLIAIVLDRLAHALLSRRPRHGTPRRRYPRLALFVPLAVLLGVLSLDHPALAVLPRAMTISVGAPIDEAVRWLSRNIFVYVGPVRDAITLWLLLPLRNAFLALPAPLVIGVLALAGARLGGLRLALVPVVLLGLMLVTGFWTPLMLTVYLVSAATVLSVAIGLPIGIWAARNDTVARVVNALCDLLQTFPSFIYLIPVIMIFQTSDLSNVMAIVFCAVVPAIRYTFLGLRQVPVETREAALALGTTPWQRLRKVELPIALPEILLGVNQTIMTALAMIAITALIGSRDLGQEIYKALPTADTGRGMLAGFGIAFIGIIADRLIGALARRLRPKKVES